MGRDDLFAGMDLQSNHHFLASREDFAAAPVVLLGAPLDQTTSFRGGTGQGPEQIRAVSEVLEEYSLWSKSDLRSCAFYDAGDLVFSRGNLAKSLDSIEKAVHLLARAGKTPLLLGGEHLLTLPAVKALHSHYPQMALLHFDAHADLRDCYLGEKISHATVMKRILELGIGNIYQFGIRSATAEEEKAALEQTSFHPFKVKEPFKECLPVLQEQPVYISIDIDLFDPGFAPGTGTPEPGGIAPSEFLELVPLFARLNIIAVDIVEVSPPYDHSQITAALAAKIVREVILAIFNTEQQSAKIER